jgi:plastocyanin
MKKIAMLVAASAVIVAVGTACSGSNDDGSGNSGGETTNAATATETPTATQDDTTAAASAATITIENMAFGDPITVAPGAEVRIANNDSVEHSVTSQAEGVFDVHVDGQQKGTLIAPTEPGKYAFYCVYHPSMKGTLIVE